MMDKEGKRGDHRGMDCPREDMIARLDAFQAQAEERLDLIKSGLDRQHAASASALRERGARSGRRVVAVAACIMLLGVAVLAAAFALQAA